MIYSIKKCWTKIISRIIITRFFFVLLLLLLLLSFQLANKSTIFSTWHHLNNILLLVFLIFSIYFLFLLFFCGYFKKKYVCIYQCLYHNFNISHFFFFWLFVVLHNTLEFFTYGLFFVYNLWWCFCWIINKKQQNVYSLQTKDWSVIKNQICGNTVFLLGKKIMKIKHNVNEMRRKIWRLLKCYVEIIIIIKKNAKILFDEILMSYVKHKTPNRKFCANSVKMKISQKVQDVETKYQNVFSTLLIHSIFSCPHFIHTSSKLQSLHCVFLLMLHLLLFSIVFTLTLYFFLNYTPW